MKIRNFIAASALSALTALPLQAQDPYERPDDTWISIDGTVESVRPDAFILNYGEGIISVEMDDGDRDSDAYVLRDGDKVTVNGIIDDDFLQVATIEASSVYVENIDTWFYSSAVDEEDVPLVGIAAPVVVGETFLRGIVTEVNGEEFTLSVGGTTVTVETEDMSYDPLDDTGFQKIQVGDRVVVGGTIDTDLFEGTEFDAESIVEIS